MNLIGLGTFGSTYLARYLERHRAPAALASASISDLKDHDRDRCLKVEVSDDTSAREFKLGLVRDWVDHSLDPTDGECCALLNPATDYASLAAHAFERVRASRPDALLVAVALLPYMKEYPMRAKRNIIAALSDLHDTADLLVLLEEERMTAKVGATDQRTAFERIDTAVQYMLDILHALNAAYGLRAYLAADGLLGELAVPSFAERMGGLDLPTAVLQNVCASDFSLSERALTYACLAAMPQEQVPMMRLFPAPTPDWELFALTFRPRYQKLFNYFKEVRDEGGREERGPASREAALMGELEGVRFGERAKPAKRTQEEELFG